MRNLILFSILLWQVLANAQNHSRKYNEQANEINWPENYDPKKAKFYVHNQIEIQASPEKVWQILIEAERWPEFYEGAQQVKIREGNILAADAVFDWETMGLNFVSTIREFEPYSRLSWESNKKQIQGYHAWYIKPTAGGCTLITDESQKGWLTFFEKIFQPRKLIRLHDIWLLEIKNKAESQTTYQQP